jgi:predicted DNA-binding protein (MmcQ/YjbR family)
VTLEDFEAYCLSLPAATLSIQWGGRSVFKVGGKIFAVAGEDDQSRDDGGRGLSGFSFKASDMAYELLIEHGAARPAPYLARAKWVRLVSRDSLDADDLRAYLGQAHGLVAAKLTRATRKALGLG